MTEKNIEYIDIQYIDICDKSMSEQLPAPAASNTFERIKRVNQAGAEFWSARELARVLEYTDFRNFIAVIAKAREACTNSGHAVPTISLTSPKWSASAQARSARRGLGALPLRVLPRHPNADPGKPLVALGKLLPFRPVVRNWRTTRR